MTGGQPDPRMNTDTYVQTEVMCMALQLWPPPDLSIRRNSLGVGLVYEADSVSTLSLRVSTICASAEARSLSWTMATSPASSIKLSS